MKIGILGSGMVAQIIGPKLLEEGDEVMISSRDITKEKRNFPSAKEWQIQQKNKGLNAHAGSFAEAAVFGDLVINCTSGAHSIEALTKAGKSNLRDKILLDLANPLDFSKGTPPSLTIANTNSLGEEIQKTFPDVKVVKTLNMINAEVMINPRGIDGEHDLFICGNDENAKSMIKNEILEKRFHWKNIIDLGDLSAARGMEAYLILWVRLMNKLGTANFNIHIQKKKE
jgi:8-hydroxy-5-deazaflavin:NADPH oxidoreductase